MNPNKGVHRIVKVGYGVTVKSIETSFHHNTIVYSIKKCDSIDFFCEEDISDAEIKTQISKYMFIKENSDVSIFVNNKIIIVKILKVCPYSVGIIQGDFLFNRKAQVFQKQKIIKQDSRKDLSQTFGKFPLYQEKLPKFLIEIMNRREKKRSAQCSPVSSKNHNNVNSFNFYYKKYNSDMPNIESSTLFQSRADTPELEKYKPQSKNLEVGKSIDDSIGFLPSVYCSPNRRRHSPQVLTIIFPELSSAANKPKITFNKVPNNLKKKTRSNTPLKMKKVKIDGLANFVRDKYSKNKVFGI